MKRGISVFLLAAILMLASGAAVFAADAGQPAPPLQPQAQVQQTQPQTTAVQSTQPETQPEYDAMRLSVKNVSGELSNYLASTYDLQYSLYDYLFHHGIRNAKTARVTSYYIDPEERTASIEISVEGAGNITAIYDRDANSYSFQ